MKVTVFGGGSFGTALGYLVAKNPNVDSVCIFTRNERVIHSINNEHNNSDYVTGFTLPDKMVATNDVDMALKGTSYIIHAIPVQSSGSYLNSLKEKIPPEVPIISSSKGICTATLKMMIDIIPESLGRPQPMVFISGPSFAKELLSDMPTGLVIASTDLNLAQRIQELFASSTIRAYTSDDTIGVEVGGALKNVFAIAAGVATGIGLGMNSKTMLVTRACAEMTRVALKMGAKQETLSGLSGIGDLMLTCFGSLSRNQTVGMRLGRGEGIKEILDSMTEVAEGVATTPAAVALARKYGIKCPIIEAVDKLLKGEVSAKELATNLMSLPTGPESEYTSITIMTEILYEKKSDE